MMRCASDAAGCFACSVLSIRVASVLSRCIHMFIISGWNVSCLTWAEQVSSKAVLRRDLHVTSAWYCSARVKQLCAKRASGVTAMRGQT